MLTRRTSILLNRTLAIVLLLGLQAAAWFSVTQPGYPGMGVIGSDALLVCALWITTAWIVLGPGARYARVVCGPLLIAMLLARYGSHNLAGVHVIALGLANCAVLCLSMLLLRTAGYRLRASGEHPLAHGLHISLKDLLLLTTVVAVAIALARWAPVKRQLTQLDSTELWRIAEISSIFAVLGMLSMVAGFKRLWLGLLCAALCGPAAGIAIARLVGVDAVQLMFWCAMAGGLAAGTSAAVRSCGVVLLRFRSSPSVARTTAIEPMTYRSAYES